MENAPAQWWLLMEHISVQATEGGFRLDPTAYLAVLPSLEGRLPGGAWEFISDPCHFDFYSDRCVKDQLPGER